jgi:hypothetical protein
MASPHDLGSGCETVKGWDLDDEARDIARLLARGLDRRVVGDYSVSEILTPEEAQEARDRTMRFVDWCKQLIGRP